MNARKRNLAVIGIIIVLIASFIAFAIYQKLQAPSRGTVTTSAIPEDLTLTLDGKKIDATGKLTVTAGKHTLLAKRSGFVDIKNEFEIKAKETKHYDFYLQPANQEGYDWLAAHPDKALLNEKLGGETFHKEAQKAYDANPLIAQLPYIGPGIKWRIDYGGPDSTSKFPDAPVIIIQGEGETAKSHALAWIINQGYDPNTMNITYTNKVVQ